MVYLKIYSGYVSYLLKNVTPNIPQLTAVDVAYCLTDAFRRTASEDPVVAPNITVNGPEERQHMRSVESYISETQVNQIIYTYRTCEGSSRNDIAH